MIQAKNDRLLAKASVQGSKEVDGSETNWTMTSYISIPSTIDDDQWAALEAQSAQKVSSIGHPKPVVPVQKAFHPAAERSNPSPQEQDQNNKTNDPDSHAPKWSGIKGVTADPSRESELGAGKWTESGRSIEELTKGMSSAPVRELDLTEDGRNWVGLLIVVLCGVLLAAKTTNIIPY